MRGTARRAPLRLVPPAGHPIGVGQILRATFSVSEKNRVRLSEELKLYAGVDHCFLVSSGTAALYLILKSIARSTGRDEVIVPAYSCPSLVAAALKAGLTVRLCDVRPDGFGLDVEALSSLVNRKTLCVVVVHLFGIPDDVDSIREAVADEEVVVVEDAAQAFGVQIDDVKLGTRGDIGFYSFGRGKTLTLLGGGAIVTDRADLALGIEEEVGKLPEGRVLGNVKAWSEVVLYSFFVHPRLYWIPSSLPFLRLGETFFVEDFRVEKLQGFHAALARVFLELTETLTRERMEKSRSLIDALNDCAGEALLTIPGADRPIPYLRLPVVLASPEARKSVIAELRRRGIGATPMYEVPLEMIDGVSDRVGCTESCVNAEAIASRLLTIPVNPYMSEKDVANVLEVFTNLVEQTAD